VLCWALVRAWSRPSTTSSLSAAGVSFHSYSEPILSTDNELVRDILLAVIGVAREAGARAARRAG
jgi:hypothetical protein